MGGGFGLVQVSDTALTMVFLLSMMTIQKETTMTKTTKTQRAAAEQAAGYRKAWESKCPGQPMIGMVKVLVEKLERVAGPAALAESRNR